MQLQLYVLPVLPVSGFSQGGGAFEHGEGPPKKLNCLLQASRLSLDQRLEVHVNDTIKRWQDGCNHIFSWELQKEGEEIHMHLRNGTAEIASWRGLWKGNAMFHLGALPVHVFFNGVEQPVAETASTVEEGGEEEEYMEEEDDQDDQQVDDLAPALEQGRLAEGQRSEPSPLEEEVGTSRMKERGQAVHDEESPLALPSAENTVEAIPQEIEAPYQGAQCQADSTLGKVAAFHAEPSLAHHTLQRLRSLLFTMPKKTVMIDLRERSRARQREEYHPLSRAHLRDEFGGKYWDRSQSIKTVLRPLPVSQYTKARRWERVVTDIDHPEGLSFLEKYLRAGYSMIFLDSMSGYEESTRHAVVTALQERIPHLEEVKFPS